jgi:hypothetical protein
LRIYFCKWSADLKNQLGVVSILVSAARQIQPSEETFYAQRASRILDLLARTLRAQLASSMQTGRIFID